MGLRLRQQWDSRTLSLLQPLDFPRSLRSKRSWLRPRLQPVVFQATGSIYATSSLAQTPDYKRKTDVSNWCSTGSDNKFHALFKRAVSVGLASVLFAVPLLPAPPAYAEHSNVPGEKRRIIEETSGGTLSIKFPASQDPALRAAQQELVEVWAYAKSQYLDPGMNGIDWQEKLQEALTSSFAAVAPEQVHDVTDQLLASLNDKFTRVLRDQDAAAFQAETEGKVIATGLAIEQDASSRSVVVAFVAEGSPAASAGLHVGDQVLAVNNIPVAQQDMRQLKSSLTKEVDLLVMTRTSAPDLSASTPFMPPSTPMLPKPSPLTSASTTSPSSQAALAALATSTNATTTTSGLAFNDDTVGSVHVATTRNDEPGSSDPHTRIVHLAPAPISFSAVQYGIIPVPSTGAASGHTLAAPAAVTVSSAVQPAATAAQAATIQTVALATPDTLLQQQHLGYIRVALWSSTADEEVRHAVRELQQRGGISAIILDLRDNPGGLVGAGVGVANLFMREGDVFCYVYDRSGEEEQVRLMDEATGTAANLPMAVLVNGKSASTSELVAGALHDTHGALLIGETTFGKGRTQRIIRLASGHATLLLSNVGYLTPSRAVVDHVGLPPDVACRPDIVGVMYWEGGSQEPGSLMSDPCIKLAADKLSTQQPNLSGQSS